MKPPKVNVEIFSGDFKKYREFKELFLRSLKNTNWSQVELFIYLKTKLKGEAYDAIANFEVDDASYSLAWEVLDRKYTNKRKLLSTTIELFSDSSFSVQHKMSKSITTFINAYQSGLANIRQLKCSADDILMEIVLPRLDDITRSRFEDFIGNSTITPTFNQLTIFLEKEQNIWETQSKNSVSDKSKPLKATRAHITNDSFSNEQTCFICNKNHKVLQCDKFLGSNDRVTLLRQHKICIFCTKHRYKRFSFCREKPKIKCDLCSQNHLTLLHPLDSQITSSDQTSAMLTQELGENTTILPTAVATLVDSTGNRHIVRCLIDLCAERSYVSEHIVQKLRLKRHKTKVIISGINGIQGKANSFVNLEIDLNNKSLDNIITDALVVPRITGNLPTINCQDQLKGLDYELADSHSDTPTMIGALLGGDIAGKLFRKGVPNEITPDGLLLQPTHLGWIVSGARSQSSNYVSTFITINESMEKLIKEEELTKKIIDFYEIPNFDDIDTANNEYCEKLFMEKHYRTVDGRYVVPIPWKPDAPLLGHSYRKSIKMFLSQENKWRKNHKHYEMSNNFMTEYEKLCHMSRVEKELESNDTGKVYYIPYLSIVRDSALTTKLRNVFNASMPTSNGISLNDTMFEGPKLQTNIKDILITSRSFKYIYSADISKMFRQILVLPSDGYKLRIIWRPSPEEILREYKMDTVTYGTDSAPYLAIRTIHQCADDNASAEISSIIKKAFYVDDLLYGADNLEQAKSEINEIKAALAAGQFPLTKWMSNCPQVLDDIPSDDKITSFLSSDNENTEIKLLGVKYNFKNDEFHLNLQEPTTPKFTKRGISSVAASFYDPLGFILPFIVMLRIFLQNIWKLKVDWDEPLLDDTIRQFKNCIQNVSSLNTIKIPRFLPTNENNILEIIGFSDASNHAQAAVLYSRVKTSEGYKVTLLTAKGNVAKIKTKAVIDSRQATIPKLELEAIVTLSELFKSVKVCFAHRTIKFTAYTDSQIALAWVRNNKRIENRFVERRVMKIRQIINPNELHYVRSEDNPADPASRGLSAQQLSESSLWFNGPEWLQHDNLPVTSTQNTTETTSTFLTCEEDIFFKFSSWTLLLRVVAYCLRWRYRNSRKNLFITASEITRARITVIKYYQSLTLGDAINNLSQGKLVNKKHWLYNLSPFIDPKTNLLLVGGRLQNAVHISESQRHPIVFPKCHGLYIFVRYTHLQGCHAGNSLLMRTLIENFWIPGVRNIIKQTIRKCTTCIRWNARTVQPEMSQLPKERVSPSNTFEKVGVDLCGPFVIKASPLKFDRTIKVWIVNFICLSTKAVHLEIVTSLTSEHFLATFSRFCARRGTSHEIWSDNGSNFIGANRMIKETWTKLLKTCEKRTAIQEINWKFIPKHSPTFGGLWEACVKSLKYFVKRMTAVQNLTYEEFSTLLCQIEAMLNSRPLCQNPLTPEEEPALTPFHFINQRGYKVSSIIGSEKVPLTKKWMVIHQVQREFWVRFQSEYLRELQIKPKWQKPQPNLEINDIVLIKEPSVTPGDWKLGKVVKTYPDPCGIVRKVDITNQSKNNSLHAVNQLVPLLKDHEIENLETEKGDYCAPRRSPRNHSALTMLQLCLLTHQHQN